MSLHGSLQATQRRSGDGLFAPHPHHHHAPLLTILHRTWEPSSPCELRRFYTKEKNLLPASKEKRTRRPTPPKMLPTGNLLSRPYCFSHVRPDRPHLIPARSSRRARGPQASGFQGLLPNRPPRPRREVEDRQAFLESHRGVPRFERGGCRELSHSSPRCVFSEGVVPNAPPKQRIHFVWNLLRSPTSSELKLFGHKSYTIHLKPLLHPCSERKIKRLPALSAWYFRFRIKKHSKIRQINHPDNGAPVAPACPGGSQLLRCCVDP